MSSNHHGWVNYMHYKKWPAWLDLRVTRLDCNTKKEVGWYYKRIRFKKLHLVLYMLYICLFIMPQWLFAQRISHHMCLWLIVCVFLMQTALHPEGNLSSRTQEHQESEQGQHSPQDLLLCKGHPVPRTWAATGQVQGLQSVHEESDTCAAQGPGTHGAQTLWEQASVYSRSHCQRKVSCLEVFWFTSTVWTFLFPLLTGIPVLWMRWETLTMHFRCSFCSVCSHSAGGCR